MLHHPFMNVYWYIGNHIFSFLSIQMIYIYSLLVSLTVSKLHMLFHSSCCTLDLVISFISTPWCMSCDLRSTQVVECGPKHLTGKHNAAIQEFHKIMGIKHAALLVTFINRLFSQSLI